VHQLEIKVLNIYSVSLDSVGMLRCAALDK